MKYSLNELYRVLKISKQAIHQHKKREDYFHLQLSELLIQVDSLREDHPGCGLEKMYKTLRPDFIGRDGFVAVFMSLGYRIKKIKNYVRTTIPTHIRFPNLIEGMCIYRKNQVWQTDITYFHLKERFFYIIFIIDVYTRKIVGYKVSDNMRAEANIATLRQALKLERCSLNDLIHHSDRGGQYVDNNYLKILSVNNIRVSMGLKAQENAYAERINGTIKNEYLKNWEIKSFSDLKRKLKKAVNHYNMYRTHSSLPGEISPIEFEKKIVTLQDQQRPKMHIFSENEIRSRGSVKGLVYEPEMAHYTHYCSIEYCA